MGRLHLFQTDILLDKNDECVYAPMRGGYIMRLLLRFADVCFRGSFGMSIAEARAMYSRDTPPPRQRVTLHGAGVRIFSKA